MRLLRCCLFLFCFFHCCAASAIPQPFISPVPSWVKTRVFSLNDRPESSEISYGYYFNLFDEQVNVEEQTFYRHSIKHITNEGGISDNSQIAIGFSGDFQQLHFHTLSVIRDGKRINKLNLKSIKVINQETELNDLQYTGLYQAMIVLEDVRKNDHIELAYSIRGRNPIFKNKYSEDFAFVAMTPVMHFFTSVMVDAGKRYNHRLYNNAKNPVITTSGNYRIYNWDDLSFDAYDNSKDLSPSWFANYPYAEITEYNNWDEVASWCLEIIQRYNYSLPAELQQKIADWDKAAQGDLMDFALKATRFVQDDIRYYGLEVGENTHRPHAPSETYAKRFGDCKDKSILLGMILRQKGIKANIALVSTSYRNHLLEHLPAANRFNHVIVKAVVDGQTIWIDPTISQQHGNLLSSYTPNYGNALVIDEEKSTIETMRTHNEGTSDITETFTIPEDADGKASLDVLSIYTLGNADFTRGKLNAGLQNIQREYENYYIRQYGNAKLDDDITVEDDSNINSITTREHYTLKTIWKSVGEKLAIEFFAQPVYERLTDPSKADGTSPVALSYPQDLIYTQVFNMPSDWTVNLQDLEIKNPYYSFSFRPEVNGNVIRIEYMLTTYTDHIPSAYVETYKKEYEKIKEALGFSLTYNQQLVKSIHAATSGGGVSNVNWIMVFVCIITLVGMNLALMKANKNSGPYTCHQYLPPSINGWLILLAISMCVRPILYIWSFFQSEYLRTDVWMALNALGNTGLQLFFIIEMISQVAMLVFSCWMLYWFFARRDVFPRLFIIMAFSELAVNIFFYTIVLTWPVISDVNPGAEKTLSQAVFRSVVFVAIWVTAVLRAQKVKDTFTRPYRYQEIAAPVEAAEETAVQYNS